MFASLEAYAQQVVDFVRIHEVWAPPIVFALAFGESLDPSELQSAAKPPSRN